MATYALEMLYLEPVKLPLKTPESTPVSTEYASQRSKSVNHLQLLKLYYNKDAVESVTVKSFLALHDDLDTLKLNESSSLSSVSSASISNSVKYTR